ncbi:MAG: helix-turn-helix domain-containing protein [Treponema sp.]|jgi:transcriptional regulator with XRE-family HTH domain|nr:helix-turn-helix domain-containing protein [Treponema sp.]
MGFKENLKAELAFKNILIKELASISGVNRRTIDNYMREDGSIPSADAAVRIAGALGVTVEYLINGNEQNERASPAPFPDSRVVLKNMEALNKRDRKIVINLIKSLKDMEDSEKKAK